MSDPNVAEAAQPAVPNAPANNVPDHELVLEPDDQDENSEVEVPSIASSTASVSSSILDYRRENGRTYHRYKDGKYNLPNDEREMDRLDLQHHMFLLSFHDKLGTAPPNEPGAKVGRVLDVGTGTGIWAMDFGDAHPEADVLGIDLSAIQPEYTPPNVKFEIDDLEEPWTFSQPFDYIHSRLMNSAVSDWKGYVQKCFENLKPGGYLELIEVDPFLNCDDGTLKPDHSVMKTLMLLMEAAQKLGAAYQDPKELKSMMIEAGFTDVIMQQLKWPTNPWPKEKRYKELGMWGAENMDEGWEAICMAPLTRAFGWTREEVLLMMVQNRKDFHDKNIHAYISMFLVMCRHSKKHLNMGFVILFAVLAVGGLLAREFWIWYRLSHVPGPFWHAITGFSMARAALNGSVHEYYMELHEKYGPLVRIGPNTVMFSDPDTLKRIAAARSRYTKGEWYAVGRTTPGEDHLFSMRDEEKRKNLKSKMGPGYSGLENGGFEAGIDKQIAAFIDLIDTKYISTPNVFRPMDMASKSTYFALDVISELGFGHAYGFLREDRDLYQYVATKDAFFPVMITMGNVPWLAKLMHSWPLNLGLPKSADSAGFGALMGFAKTFVDGRLAPDTKPGKDMIQSFINAGLTREELTQEVYVETPERWIEAGNDNERFKMMIATTDLVFGFGKFYCMGRNIALMELNKIFVELLRRYDFAIAKPEKPLKLWSAGFWITHDFWLRVSRRNGRGK
ncbi:Cytochrome P450 monooxygenase lolP1 [Colletotrichum sp. SAR 10_99]|nr:Cytochrome P450 monooxygenase lolP1 [Colletotrichum sp. SAR 10_99]